VEPLLDEEDSESDTPLPNRMVKKGDDTRTWSQITWSASIVDWAKQNMGDTYIGKRKLKADQERKKERRQR
jgi:hypothetical protein